jgi:hypothetical protein
LAQAYLPYDLDQHFLLPPDMRKWLPVGHLALFIADMVAELALSENHAVHRAKDGRG